MDRNFEEMDSNINICICSDDNYSKYAGVLIASILSNASTSDRLHFHIVEDNISKENKDKINSLKTIKDCEITFINVDKDEFSEYSEVQTHNYISLASYYLLKLPSILKNINKVIYLDCDIVVNSSIKELFDTDLDDNYVGGVLDIAPAKMNRKTGFKRGNTYVNSGVLLFDLKKLRDDNVEKQFSKYATENIKEIFCGDQQIINVVLLNKIKRLNPTWNVQTSNFMNRSSFIKKPNIIHYVSHQKPWIYASRNYFVNYYIEYLQLTPWKLSESEKQDWLTKGKRIAIINYMKNRPLIFLHPKFWLGVFCTYILPSK